MARPRKAPAAQPIITWHPSDGPTEEITPGDLCLIGGKEGTFRVASPAAPADDEAAERMAQAMYDRYHWQQAESALAAGRPPMLAAQWGEGKTRAFWLPIAIAALAALREGTPR